MGLMDDTAFTVRRRNDPETNSADATQPVFVFSAPLVVYRHPGAGKTTVRVLSTLAPS